MRLTTTLKIIQNKKLPKKMLAHLKRNLGARFRENKEINLLTILDSNGVKDMLLCLSATIQDSRDVASQLAIEFAEQALPIFEERHPSDDRPSKCIQAARKFKKGEIEVDELVEAWKSAKAAGDACNAAANRLYATSSVYTTDVVSAIDSDSAASAAAIASVFAAYAVASAANHYVHPAFEALSAALASEDSTHAAYAADADDPEARRVAREKQAQIIRTILSAEA